MPVAAIPLIAGGAALATGMIGNSLTEKGYNAAAPTNLGNDPNYAKNRQEMYDKQAADAYNDFQRAGSVDQGQFNEQYGNAQGARGQQQGFLANDMLAAARGDTSAAKAMSAFNTANTQRDLASMQASRRGPLGNTNALANAAVDAGLRNNQQSMAAAAQEKAAAQQAYLAGLGQMRAGDTNLANTAGQFSLGRTNAALEATRGGHAAQQGYYGMGENVQQQQANLQDLHRQALDRESEYQAGRRGEEWRMLGNLGASMLASSASSGAGAGAGAGGGAGGGGAAAGTGSDERMKVDARPADIMQTGKDPFDNSKAANARMPGGVAPGLNYYLNQYASQPQPEAIAQHEVKVDPGLYGHPEEDEAIARLMGDQVSNQAIEEAQANIAEKNANKAKMEAWHQRMGHTEQALANPVAGGLPEKPEDADSSGFKFKYKDYYNNGAMSDAQNTSDWRGKYDITSDERAKVETKKEGAAQNTLDQLLASLERTGTLTSKETAQIKANSKQDVGGKERVELLGSLVKGGQLDKETAKGLNKPGKQSTETTGVRKALLADLQRTGTLNSEEARKLDTENKKGIATFDDIMNMPEYKAPPKKNSVAVKRVPPPKPPAPWQTQGPGQQFFEAAPTVPQDIGTPVYRGSPAAQVRYAPTIDLDAPEEVNLGDMQRGPAYTELPPPMPPPPQSYAASSTGTGTAQNPYNFEPMNVTSDARAKEESARADRAEAQLANVTRLLSGANRHPGDQDVHRVVIGNRAYDSVPNANVGQPAPTPAPLPLAAALRTPGYAPTIDLDAPEEKLRKEPTYNGGEPIPLDQISDQEAAKMSPLPSTRPEFHGGQPIPLDEISNTEAQAMSRGTPLPKKPVGVRRPQAVQLGPTFVNRRR